MFAGSVQVYLTIAIDPEKVTVSVIIRGSLTMKHNFCDKEDGTPAEFIGRSMNTSFVIQTDN